ncbi:hypothetical protein ACFP7A_13750 [Sporolactobacillus kofuensis]|uniref:DUF4083 domain-containing protein n=1 Tax=Sporolactobacillus kofuensis TaxID=269672 RepID=A0ABW1WKR2_9BACL|nr:hypothetical protein [Sporolactobacillus kofuensis]MCO7177150.1 hypothetical protein [Sporolactobacillus kofuensis]
MMTFSMGNIIFQFVIMLFLILISLSVIFIIVLFVKNQIRQTSKQQDTEILNKLDEISKKLDQKKD